MQSHNWLEKLPYWLRAVNMGRYRTNLGCAARVYLGPYVVQLTYHRYKMSPKLIYWCVIDVSPKFRLVLVIVNTLFFHRNEP